MIILEKNIIQDTLIQISGITPEKKNVGLLHERIPLGAKRILKAIEKALYKEWLQYKSDLDEAEKIGQNEVDVLNKETVNIEIQKVDMKIIEAIESETNYNFDLIEKISQ